MFNMISNVIVVGSASFISSKIFKCMGKKEFGELMVLCGWVGTGIYFFTWLNGVSFSVSEGWFGNCIRWLASFAS